MDVCLVSAPTASEFQDARVLRSEAVRLVAEYAPTGVLSLAAILRQHGLTPRVVDLNRLFYAHVDAGARGDFVSHVAAHLAALRAEVYGFSTLCSTYPLTLRIVERLRAARPGAVIVLGGPQASVVDVATLEGFPCVDFVLRGEAEESLPRFLDAIDRGRGYEAVAGLTFRGDGGVRANVAAPVILDLDTLPLPAFDLYPELDMCQFVPLELGRGCPFACRFCSTNDFFRRRFRLKSPGRLIEQMRTLRQRYGVAGFELIHDMFTVDRRKVVAFCDALLASGEQFAWNCSARTDCVDDDLIALMARAGCRGIFYGIETGSTRLQRTIEKHLDLAEARARIECTSRHGIRATVSLITGFPEETREDLAATTGFLLDALRLDRVKPQLHLLAPLAGTPVHVEHRDALVFDDIVSDMSHQGWRQDPADLALIRTRPDVFPNFYAVPTPFLDRRQLKELRELVLHAMVRFRWVLVAQHQVTGNFLEVFDAWRAWRSARPAVQATDGGGASTPPYFSGLQFARDFVEFARHFATTLPASTAAAMRAVIDCADACFQAEQDARATEGPEDTGPAPATERPRLAAGVTLVAVDADYGAALRRLKARRGLARMRRQRTVVAVRASRGAAVELLRLTPLSAELLRLCDGRRTCEEVAGAFAAGVEDIGDVAPSTAARLGLDWLREEGLINAVPTGAS